MDLNISDDHLDSVLQILVTGSCGWSIENFRRLLFKNKSHDHAGRQLRFFRESPAAFLMTLTIARRRYFFQKLRENFIAIRRRELAKEQEYLDTKLAALSV